MKFFVLMLALGFTANLHAQEIVYNPGESTSDGAFIDQKAMDKVGEEYSTATPCCDGSQKNQQRLSSTVSNVSSSGANSGNKGDH